MGGSNGSGGIRDGEAHSLLTVIDAQESSHIGPKSYLERFPEGGFEQFARLKV